MTKTNPIWNYRLIAIGLVLILTNSCKKDNGELPVVTTSYVSNVTLTSAICGGDISNDGGTDITDYGVCWSTSANPTIADNKTNDGIGLGSFTSTITGLSSNNTYNVRAYATNGAGTGYGANIIFKTFTGTVTDIDGNVYYTVTIGTQEWMAENLKTTRYRNGDLIPNITDDLQWSNLTTGAYCAYENMVSNSSIYGNLYNWYAFNDSRNLAPLGWHISTEEEWTILTTYLGGDSVAGGKLKETGTYHWNSPNAGTNNISGFTALPGSFRNLNGEFFGIGYNGGWWTNLELNADEASYKGLYSHSTGVGNFAESKTWGFSVRCIKD